MLYVYEILPRSIYYSFSEAMNDTMVSQIVVKCVQNC